MCAVNAVPLELAFNSHVVQVNGQGAKLFGK